VGVSDHLDVFNLASGEIGYRKPQLIGRYWDDMSAEQQHNNRNIPLEGSQAFVGEVRAPFMVRPELRETVSRELERMSSIKKNARKLREEQAAAPKAKPALPKGSRCWDRRRDGLGPAAELQRGWWIATDACSGRFNPCQSLTGAGPPGELLTELVVALNQLDAGSDFVRRQCEGEPSRMQQLRMERRAESCAAMGAPPSDMSTEVALRELQVGTAYGDCDPVTAAPFVHDLVSLPAVGGAPAPLGQLLGKGGPEIVRRFIATKVLSNQDAGASFSAMDLQEGEQSWTGGVDIADAFYNMGLPSDLRRYFALPRLRAGDLGLKSVEGQSVLSRAWVRPCLAVSPMGWSRALDFCQRVHRAIVLGKGDLSETAEIVDGRPPADVSEGAFAAYVDNFVAFGTGPERPAAMLDAARKALEGAGPPVHPTEPPATVSGQLGWVFDGERGALRPKNRRVWRLRLGLLELLKKGYATGRQVGEVAGHYAFIALAQRPMLSVFNAVYSFSRKYFSRVMKLPPSVRRELQWAAALLPLAWSDLRAPRGSMVHASDASEEGGGVCQKEVDVDIIRAAGRDEERWRFRHPGVSRPRDCLGGPGDPVEEPKIAPVRWIPSERNVADAPSRRRIPLGAWLDGPKDGDEPDLACWGVRGGSRRSQLADCEAAGAELDELAARGAATGAALAACRRARAAPLVLRATLLQGASVRSKTVAQYVPLWQVALQTWPATALAVGAARVLPKDDMGGRLARWAGRGFLAGELSQRGAEAMAAVRFLRPQSSRTGYQSLPKATQVVSLFELELAAARFWAMAARGVSTCHCFHGRGELGQGTPDMIIAPTPGMHARGRAIDLRPSVEEASIKTGKFDETVAFDLAAFGFLDSAPA
ncbi:unnamed protein product, partial [Prorocentrum cordatum]